MEPLHLDCHSINSLRLPEPWLATLKILKKIETSIGEHNKKKTKDHKEDLNNQDSNAQTLYQDHHDLLKEARKLLEANRINQFKSQWSTLNEIFIEALAQTIHLSQVVLGSRGIVDTAGSATLSRHVSDAQSFPDLDWKHVATSFQISQQTIAHIETRLEGSLAYAAKKSLVIETLLKFFQIRKFEGTAQKECVLNAFHRLFPEVPLEVGEVELITSGTLWSFCIPFADGTLISPQNSRRTPDAQAKISDFLKAIRKFKQDQFARFPAFGFFDADNIAPAIIEHLVRECQEDQATIKTLLNRMISIIPLQDVDKYIVHDMWGHGWQGSLVPFDRHYQLIAHYSKPITHDPTVAPEFLDQFIVNQTQGPTLDVDKTERWIHLFLSSRLPIALTPIFAEMLADVIEFKFLADHPDLVSKMPSSSPYQFFPTKIDLLLQDIPFYFGQATKALRHLSSQAKHQHSLTNIFLKALLEQNRYSEPTCKTYAANLTKKVIEIWEALEKKFYDPHIEFQRDALGNIVTNSFTKIVLNFISIHSTIVDFNQDLHEEHPILARSPHLKNIHGFRDLAVLAVGLYFSANPTEHLWSIDEYIALIFKQQCLKFSQITP